MMKPFDHWIIDNFLPIETARQLEAEFPAFDSSLWLQYDNPLENKKTCNHWDRFPPTTYCVVDKLLKEGPFVDLSFPVIGDIGLHGGGWHIHGRGGKLNVHLDYSLHPKTKLQRKLNIILHLTEHWDEQWGGGLEFWSNDGTTNKPLAKEVVVPFKFNRAVIFRTDQQSWHGLPEPLTCPEGVYRKTIAVYYMGTPDQGAPSRERALFAPSPSQQDCPEVMALIQRRQQVQ